MNENELRVSIQMSVRIIMMFYSSTNYDVKHTHLRYVLLIGDWVLFFTMKNVLIENGTFTRPFKIIGK